MYFMRVPGPGSADPSYSTRDGVLGGVGPSRLTGYCGPLSVDPFVIDEGSGPRERGFHCKLGAVVALGSLDTYEAKPPWERGPTPNLRRAVARILRTLQGLAGGQRS